MATKVTRRELLQVFAASTVPVLPVAAAAQQADMAFDAARQPRRAVFNQQVYFNFDGNGEAYTPPAGNRSTRDYRASLSEEEFLRRHFK